MHQKPYYEQKKFKLCVKTYLNITLKHRKAQKTILFGRFGDPLLRKGEWEIGTVSGRLPYNPGDLACMGN